MKPQTFKYTTPGDLFRMVRAKAKWFEMKWGTKKNTYSKKHNEETLKWLEEEKQKDGNNHKKVRTE